MVLMPKMMESLDPEQKEQMQKQMAMQQDPSKVCLFGVHLFGMTCKFKYAHTLLKNDNSQLIYSSL